MLHVVYGEAPGEATSVAVRWAPNLQPFPVFSSRITSLSSLEDGCARLSLQRPVTEWTVQWASAGLLAEGFVSLQFLLESHLAPLVFAHLSVLTKEVQAD